VALHWRLDVTRLRLAAGGALAAPLIRKLAASPQPPTRDFGLA
jgi:hypothetical protein